MTIEQAKKKHKILEEIISISKCKELLDKNGIAGFAHFKLHEHHGANPIIVEFQAKHTTRFMPVIQQILTELEEQYLSV